MSTLCSYCKEPFLPGEEIDYDTAPPQHMECSLRGVIGSAAHQLKECSCYGGGRHDPPGMSLRDSAKLAAETFFRLRQPTE